MLPISQLRPENSQLVTTENPQKKNYCSYRGADDKHNYNPYVGKHREEGGDDEDGEGLDPPDFPGGHPGDADGRDGQQVEGGRTNDGARAKFLRLKIVSDDPDHRQKNLRGRRSFRWEHVYRNVES